MGKGGLVTERGQRPALCSFNGNAVDLDRAEAVVDDLGVGRSRNSAVSANGNRKDGGYGHGHLRSCGVAADAAVSSAGQSNGRSASAAGCVNGVCSRSRNGEGCEHTNCENEGNNLLGVFHS